MDNPTPQIPERHKAAHFRTSTISRGKGKCATAAAAYRSGERVEDERQGLAFDYRAKGGVKANFFVGPEGCERWTPGQLWNAAEKAEDKSTRRNTAVVAREFVIAVPNELSKEQAIAVGKAFGAYLHETHGLAVMMSLHDPHKKGPQPTTTTAPSASDDTKDSDNRNQHFHCLFTTRAVSVGPNGEPVFGEKTRVFDTPKRKGELDQPNGPKTIEACQRKWEELANAALDSIGHKGARVDFRSHEKRAAATGEKVIEAPRELHHGPKRTAEKRRYERKAARVAALGETPPPPPGWLKVHEKTKRTRNRLSADLRRAVLTAANGQDLDAARAAEAAAKAAAAPPPPPPIKKKPQPPAVSIFGPGGLIALRSAKTISAEKKQEAETKRAIEQDQKAAERRRLAAEKEATQRQEQEAKTEQRRSVKEAAAEAAEDAWAAKEEAAADNWREQEEAKKRRWLAKQKAKDRGSDR
jgi:MobA/MobL family